MGTASKGRRLCDGRIETSKARSSEVRAGSILSFVIPHYVAALPPLMVGVHRRERNPMAAIGNLL